MSARVTGRDERYGLPRGLETLRILQILAPAGFGGLETVVAQLCAGLHARSHQVSVVALYGDADAESPGLASLRAGGVPLEAVRLPHRAYRRERDAVRRRVTAFAPDVAHTHGYRPDVLLRDAITGLGVPLVSTAHGFTGGGLRNRVYEALQVRSLRRFDAVVAVSEPLARRLRGDGVPAERLHTVPNAWGRDPPVRSREEARRMLDLPAQAFVIGWVGRLTHEKGADLALQSVARLDGGVLALMGTGREAPALRRQAARLGLGDRIRWLGAYPEAAEYFRAFDVLLLSSRTEGTPMVLFEAMTADVPVVAAAVGGVPSVLSPREGWLAPAGDVAALAAALEEVRREPAVAAERAARARARLETQFALQPWLDRYEAVYGSAIALRRRVTP